MRVRYELAGSTATITMDDGKANALSPDMQGEIAAAFDRAEADGAAVVLTGRDGLFCAGFDLGILQGGGDATVGMVAGGFELAHRILSFPRPVVVACSGHAIAMGVFLLLCGDQRIGVAGADHKVVANEVAIGLTMPRAAIEICRLRIPATHLERVVQQAEQFTPDTAVTAGFLDRVVPADELLPTAIATAEALAGLHPQAFAGTKARLREGALAAIRAAIETDARELRPAG